MARVELQGEAQGTFALGLGPKQGTMGMPFSLLHGWGLLRWPGQSSGFLMWSGRISTNGEQRIAVSTASVVA